MREQMKKEKMEAEEKAKAADAAKAEIGKKEAAEAVKAAEAAKSVSKEEGEEKEKKTSIDDLLKCAEEQSNNIKKICRALSVHEKELKNHEERISCMEDFLFGDEVEAEDDAEKEAAKEEPAEKAKETPKKPAEPADGGVDSSDGPGQAYKYWDGKTRTYGVTANIWAAKQISKGDYDIIWVWYRNDQIDHILSDEEIKRYAPR